MALQDLTLYCLSYLKENNIIDFTEKANEIFVSILNDEIVNNLPQDIMNISKEEFIKRSKNIDWNKYHKSLPFNESAMALYHWAPVAEELKVLDKKIVLNSVILKWDNIKKEFKNLINF